MVFKQLTVVVRLSDMHKEELYEEILYEEIDAMVKYMTACSCISAVSENGFLTQQGTSLNLGHPSTAQLSLSQPDHMLGHRRFIVK